jgi:hypothetical protein
MRLDVDPDIAVALTLPKDHYLGPERAAPTHERGVRHFHRLLCGFMARPAPH